MAAGGDPDEVAVTVDAPDSDADVVLASGEMLTRNVSRAGTMFSLTLASSAWIALIEPSSVEGVLGFFEVPARDGGAGASPPPMSAIVLPARIPYAETNHHGKCAHHRNNSSTRS